MEWNWLQVIFTAYIITGNGYFIMVFGGYKTDRLFTAVNGTPIHPDIVSCWFHDFVKRTGLPEVTVHGLRHSHSLL